MQLPHFKANVCCNAEKHRAQFFTVEEDSLPSQTYGTGFSCWRVDFARFLNETLWSQMFPNIDLIDLCTWSLLRNGAWYSSDVDMNYIERSFQIEVAEVPLEMHGVSFELYEKYFKFESMYWLVSSQLSVNFAACS